MENQRLGFDAVVVDDLNGDGLPDYLLSGNVLQAGDPNAAGNVYVVAGVPLPPL